MNEKYCIVLCLSIYIAPPTAVSPQSRLRAATTIFSSFIHSFVYSFVFIESIERSGP